MGRGKIEIKRIENSTNRQVTYSKRRNGVVKKAKEITILCDAEVSLLIFSSTGKMSEYCSPSTTLIKLLDRYQKASGKRIWDAKHEYLSMEVDRIKKENDSMQLELRHLKGEDLTSLNPRELIPIETALENGLTSVRERQDELMKILRLNERTLEEENMRLNYLLLLSQHHQQLTIDGKVRDLEQEYQQKDRHYSNEMEFAIRLQRNHSNLQNK